MRAACILVVLMVFGTAAAAATAAAPSAGKTAAAWSVSELSDPMYGGTLRLARIQTSDVEAVVRCSRGAGYSEVRFYLDPQLVAGSDAVGWTFDRDPMQSAAWDRSANGRSLVVPMSMQAGFLERLKTGGTLRLYLKDTQGTKRRLDVPLRGSARAITVAMQDCAAR